MNEQRNTERAKHFLQHIVGGVGALGAPAFNQAATMVADNFEYQLLPSSLGMRKVNWAACRKWLEQRVAKDFTDFSMQFENSVAQDNRVMLEATSNANTVDGRIYNNEYRFSFTFNNAGQITQQLEFVDSWYGRTFFAPQ